MRFLICFWDISCSLVQDLKKSRNNKALRAEQKLNKLVNKPSLVQQFHRIGVFLSLAASFFLSTAPDMTKQGQALLVPVRLSFRDVPAVRRRFGFRHGFLRIFSALIRLHIRRSGITSCEQSDAKQKDCCRPHSLFHRVLLSKPSLIT